MKDRLGFDSLGRACQMTSAASSVLLSNLRKVSYRSMGHCQLFVTGTIPRSAHFVSEIVLKIVEGSIAK